MYDEAERELAHQRMNPQKTAGVLAKRWGITRRRAQDYVTGVLKRLARGNDIPLEQRQALMRETLAHIMRTAMSHKRALIVGEGGGAAHVEIWEEPNEVAALKAVELQMKMDGLVAPERVNVDLTGNVDVRVAAALSRAYGLPPAEIVSEDGESVPVLPSNTNGSNGHSGSNGKA